MNKRISHHDSYRQNTQHHDTWETVARREDENHDSKHGQIQRQEQKHSSLTDNCTDSILSPDLKAKLKGDVLVASGITFGFAPFIAIIDKAPRFVRHAVRVGLLQYGRGIVNRGLVVDS